MKFARLTLSLSAGLLMAAITTASATPLTVEMTFSNTGPGTFGAGSCPIAPGGLAAGSSCQTTFLTNNQTGINDETINFTVFGDPSGTLSASVTRVNTVTLVGSNYLQSYADAFTNLTFADGTIAQLDFSPVALFFRQIQGPRSVPEPVSLSLFGAGLAGAAALRRRRKAAKA